MAERASRSGWTRVAFGDVVRLSRERSAHPEEDGFERYVGLEHLEPGDLKIRRWGDVSEGTTFTSVFRSGQVLFGKRRAYQRKVAVVDFDGVCSGDIYVLEPSSPALLPELLPFICQTDDFFEHAIGTSAGSLSPRTNWTSLASFEFDLPPAEEQRRIAAVLEAASGVLEALQCLLAVTETVLDSEIASFDRGHGASRTGTLAAVVSRLESGTSPSGLGRPAEQDEVAVLKVSAVGSWSFFGSENKAVARDEFEERFEVRPGDLLVTRANADPDSVGRTCIVDKCRSGLMISDKTWRLVLKTECELDPMGVLAWTKSPSFRAHVRNQLGGTEAKNISKACFLSAPLPAEDVVAFNAFGARVRKLRETQMAIERRLKAGLAMRMRLTDRALNP